MRRRKANTATVNIERIARPRRAKKDDDDEEAEQSKKKKGKKPPPPAADEKRGNSKKKKGSGGGRPEGAPDITASAARRLKQKQGEVMTMF